MFRDVSHLIAPLPPGRYSSAVVTDLDGDGRCEVLLGNLHGPNRVLKWVGGMVREVAVPGLADADRPATALAAADVNGDGREEIYVGTDAPHPDGLFAATPDGTWTDLFARPGNRPVRNPNPVTALAAFDRRGTGRYGFVVSAEEQLLRVYELTADGLLSDIAPAIELDRPGDFRHLLPSPIVSERTDLFGSCRDDSNVLLVMESNGTFNDQAWRSGLADSGNLGSTAAVFNWYGRAGLAAANATGPHRFWVPREDDLFHDAASPALAMPSEPHSIFAADFDNDGVEEVLFVNHGEPHRLFRPNPDPRVIDPGALPVTSGPVSAAAVADLDGDGRLDLLLAFDDGTIHLCRAAGPDHRWLRAQPLTRFGAPARGAAVRLETAGRTQLRIIPGIGELEPVAHFGLGPNMSADELTVTWPDGATATLARPAARHLHRVPYPNG